MISAIIVIICCIIVLRAIYKIKRHVQDQENAVDTKNLLMHAFAFGVFGLLTAIFYLAQLFQYEKLPELVILIYKIVYSISLLISQTILFMILWSLGTKHEAPADDSDFSKRRTSSVPLIDDGITDRSTLVNDEIRATNTLR